MPTPRPKANVSLSPSNFRVNISAFIFGQSNFRFPSGFHRSAISDFFLCVSVLRRCSHLLCPYIITVLLGPGLYVFVILAANAFLWVNERYNYIVSCLKFACCAPWCVRVCMCECGVLRGTAHRRQARPHKNIIFALELPTRRVSSNEK